MQTKSHRNSHLCADLEVAFCVNPTGVPIVTAAQDLHTHSALGHGDDLLNYYAGNSLDICILI